MIPYYQDQLITIYHANCRDVIPLLSNISVIVTSPPYFGKYDYQVDGQEGLDQTPQEYAAAMGEIFHLALAVCRPRSVAWVIIGDTYNNWSPIRKGQNERKGYVKPEKRRRNIDGFYEKELLGVPFMVKDEIRKAGWAWRSLNIWHKPQSAPEPDTDRPLINHEYVFQFVKPEGKRRLHANFSGLPDSVWTVPPEGYDGHPAAYPERLITPLIERSTQPGEIVLDMFSGSGTTLRVAKNLGRRAIGIELREDYCKLAANRVRQHSMSFSIT